jgi:hypothetical protein
MSHIAHMQVDEIATPQFAVDSKVEQGQVTNCVAVLQVYPNGQDFLWFEGWLLADEFALVPGFALVRCGFHRRLLDC